MTILGSLDGIEAGLRQLRRSRPLETCTIDVAPDTHVVAPTRDEMLRVKAYLVVQRNAVRDYLDVVALVAVIGFDHAVEVLRDMDEYYVDRSGEAGSVLTSLVAALADPQPRDAIVINELPRYKGLDPRWHNWENVRDACKMLALALSGAD